MTRKKTASRERAGRDAAPASGRRFFVRLARFLLVVAAVGLLWWRWDDIVLWAESVAAGTANIFGWGLFLVVIFLLAIFIALIYRSLLPYIRVLRPIIFHFHQWLGGVSLILAAWGVLALFGLGGRIGDWVITQNAAIGVLRIFGFVLLGTALIAPRASYRALKWVFKRPAGKLKVQTPLPVAPLLADLPPEKAALEKTTPEKVLPASSFPPAAAALSAGVEAIAEAKKKLAAATAAPKAPEELREVAREVWRKYGEDPSLVVVDGWRLPPLEILDAIPEVEFSKADNLNRARLIEEALSSYGVDAKVVQINVGPTVTQFGIEPGWDRRVKEVKERDRDGNTISRQEEISRTRVKVERISSLANDLALSLAAPSIRIEAPVPGKSVVGIEVPNTVSSQVSLRGVIETNVYQKQSARSKLAVALGKGAGGEAAAGDLTKMPHLLIAGATGSGKTVCLNAIISGLLLQNTPYDLKFILVDPKRVELTPYDGIPHLATPVIVDIDRALSSLRWLAGEMDKRYPKMAAAGVRNIEGYNKNRQGAEKMPCLVLVIDELADLMMAGFDEVEQIICRLAQLGRAAGIHLVVATQRPSVDVVTGLIKANFPTRISFAVTSQVDSRTILDIGGAEKLLGRGDMLYMATESAKPKRLQGCYVSDAETERLVFFWSNQRPQAPPSLQIDDLAMTARPESQPEDALLEAARQLAREHQQVSASFLQRRLRIGYPRAARIMEQLEEEGFGRGEDLPTPPPSQSRRD
ncbi:MAG: DNA translocase FtsK [Dehalococcoidia bacterium]|nr:MAG: DNA translocase FtsK [Dehalococcoidia bacterium]